MSGNQLSSTIIINKKPAEKLLVGMAFSNWLQSGETISTINSVAYNACDGAGALTFSSETIVGTNVNFFIEGGSAGIRYKIIVTITTSSGQILIGDGPLNVIPGD